MLSKNTIVQLNDDLKFLIACSQTEPTKDDISFILSYLNAERFNLNDLIRLANQHGILPLVYKTIKHLSYLELNSDTPVIKMKEGCSDNLNAQRSTLNTEILTELKAHYMSVSHRNMLMSAELIRIMKLFKENNIEALAFKGPILAQMVYGDITLRQYGDLDILVDEKIAYTVGELLQAHGFTTFYPLSILKNKTYMHIDSDFAFVQNINNILIEMHWCLFRKSLGHNLTFHQFSKNPHTIKINGVSIKTLSPELHLLYLALHGSKHAWERIEWIVDIDRFIRSNKLDNKKLKETFKLMKADRPILTGLFLAKKLFHTPIPDWIVKEIENDDEIKKLYVTTIQLLNKNFLKLTQKKRSRTVYLYQRRFFKSPLEKIKYFFETYLSISPNDVLEFPLPPILNFLYILLKPFRILKKKLASKK